jgi:magnesium transporter
MVQALYRALGDECDLLRRSLQKIEESIFTGDERRMVIALSHEGRIIHDFRQALVPHREMLASLEPHTGRLFGAEFAFHLRSVEGALERIENTLENLRDSLTELRETNNSLLTTKQNEVMKTLTIMAFVTFPLMLVSSIFGMNTSYLPFVGLPGDFWFVIGIMAFLTALFFLYFKHKKWL